jgi:hypothetical protein
MLGGMAYQDPEHASIKDLDLRNLSQINAEISDTAVDIFVYDTRKDSDGGAWRKRTQHTSWYNETLGTATRGTRREFPAVAVIVAEQNFIKIYDGDDPDLPMWMVFNVGGQGMANTLMVQIQNVDRVVYALNGILVTGTKNEGSNYGQPVINFISEKVLRMDSQPGEGGEWMGTIAQRNEAIGYRSVDYDYVISTSKVNDIAMTVLPNAPIDDATGLPVPTIAVATDGGVSVIKDNGSLFDLTYQEVTNKIVNMIDIDSNGRIYWSTRESSTPGIYFHEADLPSSDSSAEPSVNISVNQAGVANAVKPTLISGGIRDVVRTKDRTVLSMSGNDNKAHLNLYNVTGDVNSSGSVDNFEIVDISTYYNTGYIIGNITGAFLSDTTAESLTANTNIATNAVYGGTNRLTSHTYDDGDTAWQMVDNASSANGYVNINLVGLTVGQCYIVSMTWNHNAALDSGYEHRIAHKNGLSGESATNFSHWNKTSGSSETLTGVFTAKSANDDDLIIYVNAITLNITNFNIRAIDEEDRSVNNTGMAVYGTLTKSAVATGADLMAYSNFSAANHLRRPRNSSMDLGTGNGYEMIWFKTTVTSGTMMMISYEGGAYPTNNYGTPFNIRYQNGSVAGWASHDNFSTYDTVTHSKSTADGYWHCAAWVRRGTVFELYVDGEKIGSATGAVGTNSLGDSNTELVIGARKRGKYPGDSLEEPWSNGSLALARIGKTAPTAEQIKKIYEEEKVLFQENAKCTIYGSPSNVTAIAYDDSTNLLYAGTSEGRSDFQGLRRINNTTTAVTTAISASNGLVVEQ